MYIYIYIHTYIYIYIYIYIYLKDSKKQDAPSINVIIKNVPSGLSPQWLICMNCYKAIVGITRNAH